MDSAVCESACYPIKTLEELFDWQPLTCNQSTLTAKSSKCFAANRPNSDKLSCQSSKDLPKTLVCHDMMGGYLEDRFVGGCSNPKAYSFTQWNFIDIFVYFSHFLITIPPPCWVHAAHIHGVSVLGTFITEWDLGASICKKIFASRDAVEVLVDKLVALTCCHGFDGWLINIENPVEPNMVKNITYFLQRLKRELVITGNAGQVIWYDSITKEGKLDWQNELNDMNRDFFDACDGIFLNYTWTPEHLSRSASQAGDRLLDVYVGIDIFGRNCFGGGGFNTSAALSVAREMRLSVALFAPGWIYECHPVDEFVSLSCKFWSLVLPHLNIHGPASLPIRTSFCPGYGQVEYFNGQVIRNEPWHNISKQQLQPCLTAMHGLHGEDETLLETLKWGCELKFGRQIICDEDAYRGGGCLLIQSVDSAIFPLFICDIPAPKEMLLGVAFKDVSSSFLIVDLVYEESDTSNFTHLSCHLKPTDNQEWNQSLTLETISKENYNQHEVVLGGTFRSELSSDWETRLFRVSVKENTSVILRAINLLSSGAALSKIGYFGCY